MDDVEAAAVEASRREVKRAFGLLKQADRRMAGATDRDSVGALVVHDDQTAAKAAELVQFGLANYDRVTVVVLAPDITPTMAPSGAKESTNGAQPAQGQAGGMGLPEASGGA